MQELKRAVKAAAVEAGFDDCGVCGPETDGWMRQLETWLDLGCHGTMGYLSRQRQQRLDLAQVLPGVRSVVMVAKGYGREAANRPVPQGSGVIARYARGRDYHEVLQQGLEGIVRQLQGAGFESRSFVDSLPVMEKALAWRAGLGCIGRNQLLIHPKLGSYVLLGGVLTTAPLAADEPGSAPYSICGDCRRCVRQCPTQALSETHLDATQCLSYWTVEQKSERLPSSIMETMGGRVFGCDACQEACPHNAFPVWPDASVFGPFEGDGGQPLEQLRLLGEEGFAQRFGHSSLSRGGWKRLSRNIEAALAGAKPAAVCERIRGDR